MMIEGNPIIFLQYDVIDNTSIWHKYKENMYSISLSYINLFIAILC